MQCGSVAHTDDVCESHVGLHLFAAQVQPLLKHDDESVISAHDARQYTDDDDC